MLFCFWLVWGSLSGTAGQLNGCLFTRKGGGRYFCVGASNLYLRAEQKKTCPRQFDTALSAVCNQDEVLSERESVAHILGSPICGVTQVRELNCISDNHFVRKGDCVHSRVVVGVDMGCLRSNDSAKECLFLSSPVCYLAVGNPYRGGGSFFGGTRCPRTRFSHTRRSATTGLQLCFGQQLCTKKWLPVCQICPRCCVRLLPKQRLREGVLAMPLL